ncbi:hypothetical protein PIB30_066026 [Stylosanthes scabra]|uniref:Retrotransposon Copia-like N-terminal domain-containing protein n=1 Tax=Stylosanthes scabra TaxID=79078 RepID=A0ABU6QMS2_9FABA|nr:hypothetical protein [Stylosanthes scabra]
MCCLLILCSLTWFLLEVSPTVKCSHDGLTSGIKSFGCLFCAELMEEKNTHGPNMVKLDSKNYSIWKTLVEDMLYSKVLYDPIEGDKAKAPKGKLTLSMVKESILNEEARRKEQGLINTSSSQKHLFQSHVGEGNLENLTVPTGQRAEANQEESPSQHRQRKSSLSLVIIVASRCI